MLRRIRCQGTWTSVNTESILNTSRPSPRAGWLICAALAECFWGRRQRRWRFDSFIPNCCKACSARSCRDQLIGHLLLSPGKARCLYPSHLRGHSLLLAAYKSENPTTFQVGSKYNLLVISTTILSVSILTSTCTAQCWEIHALASAIQEVQVKSCLDLQAIFGFTLHCVRISGTDLDWFSISSGVLQGCVAAPPSLQPVHHWPSDVQGLQAVLREFYVFFREKYTLLKFGNQRHILFYCDTWGQQPTALLPSAQWACSCLRALQLLSLFCHCCHKNVADHHAVYQCVNHKLQLVDIQYLLLCLVLFSWFWNLNLASIPRKKSKQTFLSPFFSYLRHQHSLMSWPMVFACNVHRVKQKN